MNNRNLIRFDWAIKRLLRNKADFSVLEGFLSELLKEDVQIQNVLESESNQRLDSDKYNDLVQEETKTGGEAGIQGTPASFINGTLYPGALPVATFTQIIDNELNK